MTHSIGTLSFRPLTKLACVFIAAVFGVSTAAADSLSGTALIRERVALPPGVVFEAVIEDVARAGAPATVLGRTVIENAGQSPFDFTIDYTASDLDPRGMYALRASVRHDGQLLFITDTITPVLQGNDPENVEVILRIVSRPEAGAMPSLGAHGLRLPATFRGTLPCADCEGIRHHLDLWPAQYYHLRRDWLGGTDGALRRDEIGRWYADPERGAIVLYGASDMPLFWQVTGPDTLRQMDMAGAPIVSELDYTLTSDGSLDPTPLQATFLLGQMTYRADAALFEECLSGVRYPVAQEGDYPALERAFLDAAPTPGGPLKVHVEGGLDLRPAMDGPERMSLVVDRFIKVIPGETCAPRVSTASLTDTYWRIDTMLGDAVAPMENRREPHVVLQSGPDSRFRATVGCNQMIGRYTADGAALAFGGAASLRMACPPPLDALERQLRDVLDRTAEMRLEGQTLDLIDSAGAPLARLSAVYLR